MSRYSKKAIYRTFVRDAKTGEWKQIDISDIPYEKKIEFWDNLALGAGLQRVEEKYLATYTDCGDMKE